MYLSPPSACTRTVLILQLSNNRNPLLQCGRDCVTAATGGRISLYLRQSSGYRGNAYCRLSAVPVTIRIRAPGPRAIGGRHGVEGLGERPARKQCAGTFGCRYRAGERRWSGCTRAKCLRTGFFVMPVSRPVESLSSMFWNPATMTQFSGIVSETDVSGIFPSVNHTSDLWYFCARLAFNFSGTYQMSELRPLPSGYTSYQFSPNLWFGIVDSTPRSGSRKTFLITGPAVLC